MNANLNVSLEGARWIQTTPQRASAALEVAARDEPSAALMTHLHPPARGRARHLTISPSHHLTVSPSPDCRQTVAQRMLYRCIINASSADVGRHLTKPCRSLGGVLGMPTCSIACDDMEGCSSVRRRASTDAAGVGRTRFDDGMMSATRSSTVLAGEIQQTFGLGVRFAQACAPEAVGGGHAKHGVGGAGSRGPAGTTRASYRNRTARR
jgi:hypothetical protein